MRVSSSWRVWSSSETTTILASSCCGACQPGRGRRLTLTWTYVHHNALAEAGASVEPVIVLELVDLDALAIVGRWRYQGHSPREGSAGTRAATDVPSAARNAVATGRAGLGRAARAVPRARWWSGVVCDVRAAAGQMTIRRLGVGGRQMRRRDRGATGQRNVWMQCAMRAGSVTGSMRSIVTATGARGRWWV
jgi:hypothetical protein